MATRAFYIALAVVVAQIISLVATLAAIARHADATDGDADRSLRH